MRAVYITYDGVLEPLGESQVLPYVHGLAARGVGFTLISFEKREDLAAVERVADLRGSLEREGITWIPLRYHKRPTALATAWDILRGAVAAMIAVREARACLVHARSYVASVMAWIVTRVTRASLLFDMRGFWVDERVEGGLWRRDSWLFRTAKAWERRLLRDADGIVVLSQAAVPHLEELAGRRMKTPVLVVPTCVDLDVFRPADRAEARSALGLPGDAFVLVYVGSFGTWYLGPETFRLAQAVADLTSPFVFVVLTRHEAEASALVPDGLRGSTRILSVAHAEVARWLAAADAGAALVRPTFSKVASCPTKLGEYLACGIPVASTAGIGDVDRILADVGGTILDGADPDGIAAAAKRLVTRARHPGVRDACRLLAVEEFSLEGGVARLASLYERLGRRAC